MTQQSEQSTPVRYVAKQSTLDGWIIYEVAPVKGNLSESEALNEAHRRNCNLETLRSRS